MIKLINENGKKHDYSHKSKPHITHMVTDMSQTFDVEFKMLSTHSFIGTFRTAEIISNGDFIYKTMESGKIGVYEVTNRMFSTVAKELCEPFRDYKCEVVFCGYLQGDGIHIDIFSGYGIR